MKCPHCGQEHPDDTKFCPQTGKKVESQYFTCNNPDCNYRRPLPLSAKFCPNCGISFFENTSKNEKASCFLLRLSNYRYNIIDISGNPISEKSFQLAEGDLLDDEATLVQDCLISDGSKTFLALANGKLLEIDNYNDDDIVIKSVTGQYILTIHNRSAKLYRKGGCGLVLLSQFRFKYKNVGLFDVIDDYISFFYSNGFASVNYKNGEILKISDYKYSILLTTQGNEHICMVSNSWDQDSWYENSRDFGIVDLQGKILSSYTNGVYWPTGDSKYLLRVHKNKIGLVSINGKEIIPAFFDNIEFCDENHMILHLGDLHDWKRRKLIYDLADKSFVTTDSIDDQKVKCIGEQLPESTDELDELLKSYKLGFGYSSDYIVNENNEIIRRCDQKVIYQMDENEYPIGASDALKRFCIYDQEYLSIYDSNGKLLKEFYHSKGIANPRLYDNGIILFYDGELEELCVIDVNFNLTTIHSDDHFDGNYVVISSNCIAVRLPFADMPWILYNASGELILPRTTMVYNWKKLNNQFVVLETGNYKTNQDLGFHEKSGILINLNDNSISRISIPYEDVFLLG